MLSLSFARAGIDRIGTRPRPAAPYPQQSNACTRRDVRLLAGQLGLTTASAVLAVATEVYGDRLDTAARFFVEEVFG